jgi:hypothetical protein
MGSSVEREGVDGRVVSPPASILVIFYYQPH